MPPVKQAKPAGTKPKSGGTKAKAAEEPEAVSPEEAARRAQQERSKAVFTQYDEDQDGALNLKEFAQVIKDVHEEAGYLRENEMGLYIKKQYREAGSGAAEGAVREEQFVAWHVGFVSAVDEFRAAEAAKREAAEGARAAERVAATQSFATDGVWSCKLDMLQAALDAARDKGKTPLLLDRTGSGDGYTPLETFYSYSGHQLVELKKYVVEVNMKKTMSLEDARAEMRTKIVLALKRGYELVLLCSNAAPPLTSQFASADAVPLELLDQPQVAAAVGLDGDWKGGFLGKMLTKEDDILFCHKDFAVSVVSKFTADDYAEFLAAELPLDKLQPITVTAHA